MPENSNGRGNPVTKKVEYSPTTPNYVAETFAAQQRQRQVQNNLQGIQDALDNINATVEDFQQRRRDLGIYTEEEKEAARLAAIERTQEELSDLDGNSEDAEGIYRSFASPEDIRTMEIAKGVGTTVATLPFTVGMVGGGTPGIITTATGAAGGYAGAYGGQQLGQYIDNKFKTNTTPGLTFAGGLFGGALGGGLGYKGTVKLGSRGGLPKGGQTMYGKQFITDVASDALSRNVTQITPTLNYGTVKYYGPTMGKTTAAKTNPNLVDFDDYVRGDLDVLASQLGMTRQQLMMSQDPTVRENARQLMLKSIEGGRQNPSSYGKTLVISKSDVLQDPIFDNQPLVLQRPEFLKRNAARGETDLQNSMDGYASTRRKGGNKLMEWPDPEGVYISELEPFTPDPHHITFTPQSSKGAYTGFERPSKLTIAERMGIPKGERSNPAALEDPQYGGYEQGNERYDAAVRAGNWEEVQRLRDLHFKVKAPDTKIIDESGMPRHMYHGRPLWDHYLPKRRNNLFTKFEGINGDLEEYVDEGSTLNHGMLSKPNRYRMNSYHTPEYDVAKRTYAHDPRGVMDNYLYIKNPANGNEVKQITGLDYISDWANFSAGKKELMELGYDGLYIPQYHDSYGAFVSPSQFKSADPITGDGKGNIIPIVKRDNFRNLDTRYNKGGKIENPDH